MLSLFLYCGQKQQEIERYIEDGVEVIVNHLEPYKIKGKPTNLILEEEFTIDTEKDDILHQAGLCLDKISLCELSPFSFRSFSIFPWTSESLLLEYS